MRHPNDYDPLVPPHIGSLRFDWVKSLWLWGLLLPGLVLGIPVVNPTLISDFPGANLPDLMPRSFRGPAPRSHSPDLPRFSYYARVFGLPHGSGWAWRPLSWIRLHAVRDYWQNRRDCPRYLAYEHGLITDFFWNLHLSFQPAGEDPDAYKKLPPGILRDPWLRFLETTWPLHNLAFAALIYLLLGPAGVLVCFCGRTAMGILGHWAIGYASHAYGQQRFVISGAKESGTNNWLLGILSFGEGFHNNHHAFPWSANMGMKPYDFDLGWMVIRCMERLGLVYAVRAWSRELPSPAL